MDRCAGEHNPDPRRAGIDLRYHLGLFIGRSSDHEDDDVLRLVTIVAAALEEWILELLQSALDQVL
jgi:hypothetical protein